MWTLEEGETGFMISFMISICGGASARWGRSLGLTMGPGGPCGPAGPGGPLIYKGQKVLMQACAGFYGQNEGPEPTEDP